MAATAATVEESVVVATKGSQAATVGATTAQAGAPDVRAQSTLQQQGRRRTLRHILRYLAKVCTRGAKVSACARVCERGRLVC